MAKRKVPPTTHRRQVHADSRLRAAVYARVSTTNNGQSPEMQLRELREYCQRRG